MTKLSVNINKVATIRNARGGMLPNLIEFAKKAYQYGAAGITIHPRPDERHITKADTLALAAIFPTQECEFNIEGYPSPEFLDLAIKAHPTQITLVPDAPNAITSNAGWDTIAHFEFLKDVIGHIQKHNIRVSLFMDPDLDKISKAAELGAERIEFYTGPYAQIYPQDPENAIAPLKIAATHASQLGLELNAGHDLNLENLTFLIQHIPNILEVSIGHALISDCLYFGLENVISMYKRKIELAHISINSN